MTEESIPAAEKKAVCVTVDHGPMVFCAVPAGQVLDPGAACIVDVEGRLEFGRVSRVDNLQGHHESKDRWAKIVRRATLQDQSRASENALMSRMAKGNCLSKAQKHKLQIQLVRVRYSFDRSSLEVLFTSDQRIDVREAARELAGELKTRVDMKQIGVRDAAGIMGGMGPCGREMCCCRWLHTFKSVNVKMVKAQGISPNPNAVSGMCGRLKCCIRYECDERIASAGRGHGPHGHHDDNYGPPDSESLSVLNDDGHQG